jgi:hypothetical protein
MSDATVTESARVMIFLGDSNTSWHCDNARKIDGDWQTCGGKHFTEIASNRFRCNTCNALYQGQ